MREIGELADVDDPAWPVLEGVLAASSVPARVFPVDHEEGRRCLLQMQVTARSVLGALVLNTGGLLLDDGWVRVFGGGVAAAGSLPSLGQVNRFPRPSIPRGIPLPVSSSATTSWAGSSH